MQFAALLNNARRASPIARTPVFIGGLEFFAMSEEAGGAVASSFGDVGYSITTDKRRQFNADARAFVCHDDELRKFSRILAGDAQPIGAVVDMLADGWGQFSRALTDSSDDDLDLAGDIAGAALTASGANSVDGGVLSLEGDALAEYSASVAGLFIFAASFLADDALADGVVLSSQRWSVALDEKTGIVATIEGVEYRITGALKADEWATVAVADYPLDNTTDGGIVEIVVNGSIIVAAAQCSGDTRGTVEIGAGADGAVGARKIRNIQALTGIERNSWALYEIGEAQQTSEALVYPLIIPELEEVAE